MTEATLITDEWLCQEGDLSDFLCINYEVDGQVRSPYVDTMEEVYAEMKSKIMRLYEDRTMPTTVKNMEINSTLNITV